MTPPANHCQTLGFLERVVYLVHLTYSGVWNVVQLFSMKEAILIGSVNVVTEIKRIKNSILDP
jgi:hypothetical protein